MAPTRGTAITAITEITESTPRAPESSDLRSPAEPSRAASLPKGRRRALAVLTAALPFVLLLALEGGLRLAGFGKSYPLFVPVPEAPGYLRANRDVVRRFMVDERDTPNLWIRPVYFPRRKAPGTFRIFVQGESTTEGYPYGFGASPAGMLQQRLQRTFPERRIEVVTTAMSAVNTYTLLDFSGEILEQEPDAVVLYVGHNEYVGLLGAGSGFSVGRRRPVVLAFLRLKDVRILQLGRRVLAALRPERPRRRGRTLMATIVAEKEIPYGSPLYRRGLAQYRANLRALLRRYREAGVPVFIGTVVSNERDQPPFISDPKAGADSAAGHFARAQALEKLGRYAEARQAYLAAKDRDLLRFRAPEEINVILREVAAEQGAHVVEVQEAFRRASRNGIVGRELMLEHLHPNLDGYFLLADAFYEAFRRQALIGPWAAPVPRAQARREIPVTEVDRFYGEWRARYLKSDWPFTARRKPFRIPPPSDRAGEIAEDYYRGRLQWPDAMRSLLEHYRSIGDETEAARVAVLLAEAFPNRAEDQRAAAAALLAAGRSDAAVYQRRVREMTRRRSPRLTSPSSPG
jgi:lysophospholipase L1-like esterase